MSMLIIFDNVDISGCGMSAYLCNRIHLYLLFAALWYPFKLKTSLKNPLNHGVILISRFILHLPFHDLCLIREHLIITVYEAI